LPSANELERGSWCFFFFFFFFFFFSLNLSLAWGSLFSLTFL